MKPTHFIVIPLFLWTTALAGGGGSSAQITPSFVLRGLPGVTVTEAPTGNFELDSARWRAGANYTYAVRVRVGTEQVRVLLSPGAAENSVTVNTVMAYVDMPTASVSQRQALIARGFLEACTPQLAGQAQSIWPGLARYNWAGALGWQDRLLGSLRVGWSGDQGMGVGDRDVTGVRITWPRSSGRCVF